MLGGGGQLGGEELLVACQRGGVSAFGELACRRRGQGPEKVEEAGEGAKPEEPRPRLDPTPAGVGLDGGRHDLPDDRMSKYDLYCTQTF